MSGSDWFGGCLGIVAAGLLGLVIAGPLAALLGALLSAVIVGLVLSAQERKRKAATPASNASAPSPAVQTEPAPNSAEEALRQLERLRTSGLITPEEYAAKKAEILERL
jgi:predicted lipid-binding transport protein (Tim44 family)